jgi:hypothetical protein
VARLYSPPCLLLLQHMARWERGYPADCKSVYTSSNLVRASTLTITVDQPLDAEKAAVNINSPNSKNRSGVEWHIATPKVS